MAISAGTKAWAVSGVIGVASVSFGVMASQVGATPADPLPAVTAEARPAASTATSDPPADDPQSSPGNTGTQTPAHHSPVSPPSAATPE